MATFAPSAASPSATALPSPLLAAATIATRSFSPRSIALEIPIEDALAHRLPLVRARIDRLEVARAFQRHQLCIPRFLRKSFAHLERDNLIGGAVDHALRHGNRQ